MSNGLTKSSGHTRGDIEYAHTVALGRSERLPRGGDMGAAPRRISTFSRWGRAFQER